jgi:hypothetical protein
VAIITAIVRITVIAIVTSIIAVERIQPWIIPSVIAVRVTPSISEAEAQA